MRTPPEASWPEATPTASGEAFFSVASDGVGWQWAQYQSSQNDFYPPVHWRYVTRNPRALMFNHPSIHPLHSGRRVWKLLRRCYPLHQQHSNVSVDRSLTSVGSFSSFSSFAGRSASRHPHFQRTARAPRTPSNSSGSSYRPVSRASSSGTPTPQTSPRRSPPSSHGTGPFGPQPSGRSQSLTYMCSLIRNAT
jgi:hypothetical protein